MAPKTLVKNAQVVVLIATVLATFLKAAEDSDCVYNIETATAVVTSPNYPNLYPLNQTCVWNFVTTPWNEIRLELIDLSLESHSSCSYDYVAIYDGHYESSENRLGLFCGEMPRPHIVLPTSHKMRLVFQSDASHSGRGFRARYVTASKLESLNTDAVEKESIEYFLSKRRDHISTINKWGTHITRTAVALFLNEPRFFAPGNDTGEEIAYELTLQLMAKLVLKKQIDTKDLALFVNAMTVACIDPKNFFGINIVDELRKRVDSTNQTNPFFILALCLGGDSMKTKDVDNLRKLFHAHVGPSWTGTQAMAVMALKCISRQPPTDVTNTLNEMVAELKTKDQDNLKNTALVIQALAATDSYGSGFNITAAVRYIIEKMHTNVSFEDYYYILPIFRWKTLLDVNSNHCANIIKTDLEQMAKLREHPDERIQVQISIVIGDDMDFSRTWKMKVPSNYSFYQVLENISSSEPDYRMKYGLFDGKPCVIAVSSFQNSIEDGSFWFIFTKPISSADNPILVKESPVDISVNERDELILWYRSWPKV